MQTNMGEQLMKELLDIVITEHHLENYKPSWLNGLELDRYYPSLRCAFEFQGDQHRDYSFSLYDSHIHFLTQVQNDMKKKQVLVQKKIKLIEIDLNDLQPDIFYSKVSEITFREDVPELPRSLSNRIRRYQTGVPIHYKKEARMFIDSTRLKPFLNLPFVMRAVDEFSPLSNLFSPEEKMAFCVLSILSRQDEVQFTLPQLKEIVPEYAKEGILLSLAEKGILVIHPTYFLIKLKSDERNKILDFIEKTIKFISNKGIVLD